MRENTYFLMILSLFMAIGFLGVSITLQYVLPLQTLSVWWVKALMTVTVFVSAALMIGSIALAGKLVRYEYTPLRQLVSTT
jgi:hypothetical protein